MKKINFSDCVELGFKQQNLQDELHIQEHRFDDFEMSLKLSGDYSLCWEWTNKKVRLYLEEKYQNFEIIDLSELIMFVQLAENNALFNCMKARNRKEVNELPWNHEANIKHELVSELHKITDGEHFVFVFKEKGKTKILNEYQQSEFVFQNPEISKKVCDLIIYAFETIK